MKKSEDIFMEHLLFDFVLKKRVVLINDKHNINKHLLSGYKCQILIHQNEIKTAGTVGILNNYSILFMVKIINCFFIFRIICKIHEP